MRALSRLVDVAGFWTLDRTTITGQSAVILRHHTAAVSSYDCTFDDLELVHQSLITLEPPHTHKFPRVNAQDSKVNIPSAKPGALVLEPLEAAYPCCSSQASIHSVECLTPHQQLSRCNLQFLLFALHLVWPNLSSSSIDRTPLRVLGGSRFRSFADRPVSTAGYVKLLLPPRQSRGNSHWGLGPIQPWDVKDFLRPGRGRALFNSIAGL